MIEKKLENLIDDEIIAYEEEEEVELWELEDEGVESSVNIPINGSPLYPRIYVGDSARQLQGEFSESGYIDDNINRTWVGMLSFYG